MNIKMAASVAGLPQAQNQAKQQAGVASDRSLRSVFGALYAQYFNLFNNRGASGAINEYLPHDWARLHHGRNVGDSARSVALNS